MFQAVTTLLLLTSLLISSPVLSDQTEPFWVLGSYSKADNAHREQARLSDELGIPVEVRFDERLSVFRILISANQMNREQLGQKAAWRINIRSTPSISDHTVNAPSATAVIDSEPSSFEKEPQAQSNDESFSASDSKIIEEPPTPKIQRAPEPLFAAFEPDESLTEYCLRLPQERLCQHPRIERALEADRKLMNHRQDMLNICKKVSNPGRRKTCEELH